MLSKKNNLSRTQGQIVKANGIDIWYETFGDKKNKPLLLIMGGCCQGVLWPRKFCEQLADVGFYVIRYDHRDAGLSTAIDFEKNPYDLMDQTNDAVGLLDALGIEKVHIFGLSMGAIMAGIIGAYFSHRVNSLLLMGSTCEIRPMNRAYAGEPPEENAEFPPPTQQYLDWMRGFMKQSPQTDEEILAQRMEGWNQLSGSQYPLGEKINREIQQEFLARLRYPQGILNHIRSWNNPRSEELTRSAPSKVNAPTVIIHGSEDPIFTPVHAAGLSERITHADYVLVEGMGHVPSEHFYDLYIKILKQQANIS